MSDTPMITVCGLKKTFTLHHQGGIQLPALSNVHLTVQRGECVVLYGPSGAGKSTLLRSIYANYKPQTGAVRVRHGDAWVDMVTATPQRILEVRHQTLGYVSQFLRVIPRVPTIDVVSEPLLQRRISREAAYARAQSLLTALNIPRRLWDVAPATFSGGEQQRVNIARGFVFEYPVLLLDEPTASLEAENRAVVIDLIRAALARGAAIVGIFHDEFMQQAVGTRLYRMGTEDVD